MSSREGILTILKVSKCLPKDYCDITLKKDFAGVKKCILSLFASSEITLTVKQSQRFG